jgi:peroxiredoxin
MKFLQNIVLAAVLAYPAGAMAKPEIGKPAPDFSLKDQDGKAHKLKDLLGKIVVLEWTSPRCPFTLGHYERKTMTSTAELFKDKPVVWLAVDSSYFANEKETKEWTGRWSIPYKTLMDADGKVGHAYAALTTPHMFVIDQKGILRYDGAIDDDAADVIKFKTNYVYDAVKALLDNKDVKVPTTQPYGCGVKYKS